MPIQKIKSGLRRYPSTLARSFGHDVGLPLPSPSASVTAHSFWADHEEWQRHEFAACWIGHASILLRIADLTILCDPVWSERIGMRVGGRVVGPERLLATPGTLEQIPPVDLILLTHAHFDHLDRPTLQRLASPHTTVVAARNMPRLIPSGFKSVRQLSWGRRLRVSGARIHAIEPNHWGARTVWDRHRGCNSYLIEYAGKRVLFSGDTADTDTFNDLAPIDLAIMGIGAYEPWVDAHSTPEQAWRMTEAMKAHWLLPMHHSTFELGEEPIDEPMQRLLTVADAQRIVCRTAGELFTAV